MIIAQRRLVALHRDYTRGLLAAHEEERAWVAREVHDDAMQRLAVLHHELQQLQQPDGALSPAQRHHVGGIIGEVQDLSASLRQLAHRLHPAAIEHAGLAAALKQLAGEVARTSSLPIDVQIPSDDLPLPSDRALVLFRIAQEALRNAVRHAAASSITLALAATEDGLELRIADDGRGFETSGARKGGIGLISIRERARLVGGQATIQSRPGGGTVVTVRVPSGGTAA
jgi:signal transduction histidine kinase